MKKQDSPGPEKVWEQEAAMRRRAKTAAETFIFPLGKGTWSRPEALAEEAQTAAAGFSPFLLGSSGGSWKNPKWKFQDDEEGCPESETDKWN